MAPLSPPAAARRDADPADRVRRMERVGALAAGIAHDLNNLLLVAQLNADALGDETDAAARELEREELQSVLSRAMALIHRVLAAAHGDADGMALIVPAEVVRRLVPVLQRMLGTQVALVVEVAADAVEARVLGDAVQLEQVLINLAGNARDAMPDGGLLRLRLGHRTLTAAELQRSIDPPPGRFLQIAVEDTGTGMSPEIRQRIFEPFFTTKAPGAGTGIGLASSLELVRRMGGAMMVDSVEGMGSTFHVLLPAPPMD